MLSAAGWYWVILIIWIIFGVGGLWIDDVRWHRAGNFVLIILLILNGFMDAGSPIR